MEYFNVVQDNVTVLKEGQSLYEEIIQVDPHFFVNIENHIASFGNCNPKDNTITVLSVSFILIPCVNAVARNIFHDPYGAQFLSIYLFDIIKLLSHIDKYYCKRKRYKTGNHVDENTQHRFLNHINTEINILKFLMVFVVLKIDPSLPW